MLSFRSILFAAAAFVTMASAIPTNLPISDVGNAGTIPASDVVNPLKGGATKRGEQSCGDYYTSSTKSVTEIVVQIEAVIYIDGDKSKPNKNCDHKQVISLLGEIIIVLKGLLVNLKIEGIVALTLNGVVITVAQLTEIVAGLLILLIDIVYEVLIVVGLLDEVIIGLVAEIGVLLLEVLTAVVVIVAELKVEVAVILKAYVSQCGYLHYVDFLGYLSL